MIRLYRLIDMEGGSIVQEHNIRVLVINPGSTSTKIGVFEGEKLLMENTLRHSSEEIAQYPSIIDQYNFRKEAILECT